MEFKIIKKRVDPRGTSFTAFEPTNQLTFKELVQVFKTKPWLSWVLCPYLKDFIDRDPLLALKLNLLAAKPEMGIFRDLLEFSDIDLFPAIALVELFNFHAGGWVSKALDITDPRFLYLDPFIKRAYHSKLRDSSEFQLIMWRLEQENGFF